MKIIENHAYIQELLRLNNIHEDRKSFHDASNDVLHKMGTDQSFLDLVIQRNFLDKGYTEQEWSLYNIPFLYVHETADYNLKIHIFPALESKKEGIAASCIHHHNNYMLSTFAFHGSGYESFLFNKDYQFDEQKEEGVFKITKHFHQQDWPISFVDSWEPHLVFNPVKLSATLILWTPDKKRGTDALRQNPILKAFKKPLRNIINMLGLNANFGISAKKTFQFYPSNNQIKGILEDTYFEPTRKAKGKEVDIYSIQSVFKFIQEGQYLSKDFLEKNRQHLPEYYQEFITAYLKDETIAETFAKPTINIPNRQFTKEEVLAAAQYA